MEAPTHLLKLCVKTENTIISRCYFAENCTGSCSKVRAARAARAARFFLHVPPIKFLICGVVVASDVVDAKALWSLGVSSGKVSCF